MWHYHLSASFDNVTQVAKFKPKVNLALTELGLMLKYCGQIWCKTKIEGIAARTM